MSGRVIGMSDTDKEKAKEEVIDYLKSCHKAYPSDVADALQLDFDLVLEKLFLLLRRMTD